MIIDGAVLAAKVTPVRYENHALKRLFSSEKLSACPPPSEICKPKNIHRNMRLSLAAKIALFSIESKIFL